MTASDRLCDTSKNPIVRMSACVHNALFIHRVKNRGMSVSGLVVFLPLPRRKKRSRMGHSVANWWDWDERSVPASRGCCCCLTKTTILLPSSIAEWPILGPSHQWLSPWWRRSTSCDPVSFWHACDCVLVCTTIKFEECVSK
jgi:hypothetical protein